MSDVLIIGGGIAGVSAAAKLAGAASVTLLEGEDVLAHHASGRSAAMFLEHYGNAVVRALNAASAAEHQSANVLSPRGILMLGGPEDRAAFDAEVAAFEMAEIAVAEARARVPILDPGAVAFAATTENALDIDTDRALQAYARQARAAGAEIVTRAPVTAIAREGDRWRVRAGERAYEADILVNAAGAWADAIAAMAGVAPLGLKPYRRSMARIPAPGGQDVAGWPFLLTAKDDWYAKPDAGQWIVSPSEEDAMAPFDAYADDMVIAEGLARYEAMVTTPVTRVTTTWAGLRTFAPDRALVLGRDAAVPAFVWCAGQGGYGFQTAPAASDLVADLILGRAPGLTAEVVAALDPGRFG